VRETATHYVIIAGDTCIAQHAKAGRHAVVMEPAHYAGLLRPGAAPLTDAPQWDPAYHALGAVEVRDLTIYDTLSAIGGGQEAPRSSIACAVTVSACGFTGSKRISLRYSSRPPSARCRTPTFSTSSWRWRSARRPKST
jgi:hypothetical protein